MVDVSTKPKSVRTARAVAFVRMSADTVSQVKEGGLSKGDALGAARLAGIMAAKKTYELIPLCHPLSLTDVNVEAKIVAEGVEISTQVKTNERTGVEMEALTAAAVAALTVYDMCKSLDKGISIERVQLVSKTGGKSGAWSRNE
jgi:cyclic pyranopterin phosphate synthase